MAEEQKLPAALKPIQDELNSIELGIKGYDEKIKSETKRHERYGKIGKRFGEYFSKFVSPLEQIMDKYKKDDPASIMFAVKAVASYNVLKSGVYERMYGENEDRHLTYKGIQKAGKNVKRTLDEIKNKSKGFLYSGLQDHALSGALSLYQKSYKEEVSKLKGDEKKYEEEISSEMKRIFSKLVKIQ